MNIVPAKVAGVDRIVMTTPPGKDGKVTANTLVAAKEAGATKVEIVTEELTLTETTSHSLDKKFDKSGIKQEYTSFCANKGISNIEMGLQYLDKIS